MSAPLPYKVQKPPLDTDWTFKVGTNAWPEYPRPLLRRDDWKSLNGIWTYEGATATTSASDAFRSGLLGREVLIPSCIESALSGIQELDVTNMRFARNFAVPASWAGKTILLNFEAVDYETIVFVNGVKVGHHIGGYFRFSVDVSKHVSPRQDNHLLVLVYDPTDLEVIPSVWMEAVSSNYITQLDVSAAADGSGKNGAKVKYSIIDKDGLEVLSQSGYSDTELKTMVDSPKLWSPSSPTLYNITASMDDDHVHSYAGFRTISAGLVHGIQRPLLNGKFHLMIGTLDQGFWPDGVYTPPSREAMVYDLAILKSLGFNMIKVEPDLFYQACDEIGLMVFQDMPSLPDDASRLPNPTQQQEFQRQLEMLINEHKGYPSIVTLVDAVTGWHDHGFGDYSVSVPGHDGWLQDIVWIETLSPPVKDNHHYANPQCGAPFYSLASSPYDSNRIGFQGEFGGVGHNVSAKHLWKVQQAVDTINQTYELNADLEAYNYRASVIFRELREQIEKYACSGGVWTQTTDVEGEVNGLLTYDRRLLRPNTEQWRRDIQKLLSNHAGSSNHDIPGCPCPPASKYQPQCRMARNPNLGDCTCVYGVKNEGLSCCL
ncbi:hypothetical protein RJ55_04902 [Drechmeria coniospora]|nr:hypothetical protein RJ55_04902 [Drechmeria coniospora]